MANVARAGSVAAAQPEVAKDAPATADEKAVTALGDFTKWFTGLATAGLAFSIGLQANLPSYGEQARTWLVFGWTFYALAVVAGVLVQSSFPKMIQRRWTIDNPYVKSAYLASFAGLVLGAVSTAFALWSVARSDVAPDQLSLRTAQAAVARALAFERPGERLRSINKVEALSGTDSKSVGDETWHVQYTATRGSGSNARTIVTDVYLDAADGRAATYDEQQVQK